MEQQHVTAVELPAGTGGDGRGQPRLLPTTLARAACKAPGTAPLPLYLHGEQLAVDCGLEELVWDSFLCSVAAEVEGQSAAVAAAAAPLRCHALPRWPAPAGSYPITIGKGAIIHPRAQIRARAGPIAIGDHCILDEWCVVENVYDDEGRGSGAVRPRGAQPVVRVGAGNHLQPHARIRNAGDVGDFNVFGPFAVVCGRLARVGSHCIFVAYVRVAAAAGVAVVIADGSVLLPFRDDADGADPDDGDSRRRRWLVVPRPIDAEATARDERRLAASRGFFERLAADNDGVVEALLRQQHAASVAPPPQQQRL